MISSKYPNGSDRMYILEKPITMLIDQYTNFRLPRTEPKYSYFYGFENSCRSFFMAVELISIIFNEPLKKSEIEAMNKIFYDFLNSVVLTSEVVRYSEIKNRKKYQDDKHWARIFKATWRKQMSPYENRLRDLIDKYKVSHINPFLVYLEKSNRTETVREINGSFILGKFVRRSIR